MSDPEWFDVNGAYVVSQLNRAIDWLTQARTIVATNSVVVDDKGDLVHFEPSDCPVTPTILPRNEPIGGEG